MSRLFLTIILSLLIPGTAFCQGSPFKDFNFGAAADEAGELEVSAAVVSVDATSVDLRVTVQLPPHNYIYSATTPFGIPTKISITKADGFELVGSMTADRKPKVVFDKSINATMEKFYDTVTWTQRLKKKSGSLQPGMIFVGELEGQYCSDQTCIQIRPPARFEASLPSDFVVQERAAGVSIAVAEVSAGTGGATIRVVPEMRLPKRIAIPPISFTISLTPENPRGGDTVTLSIQADIAPTFHTYSVTQNPETLGAAPTNIQLQTVSGLQPIGSQFTATPAPELKKSDLDDGTFELHHDSVVWTHKFVMTGDAAAVDGVINFQVCDDQACFPGAVNFHVGTVGGASLPAPTTDDTAIAATESSKGDFGDASANEGLLAFILSAFGFGFAALLTPCVYPMIPVTIAFFLKQGEERPRETMKLACVYCGSIVGAFTILGLALSVVLGPAAIPELANGPWLNLFFAAIFTVFALMLMGLFEIQIPSWVLTWTSKKQGTGGVIGVVFMALTFTLVSFTCTFAFVGQIVVWAAQGDFFLPIIGMVAFSSAFASPFFLLAMFPSLLKKMPNSGGWMNSVKVTLGLVELAVVTKFLSVADIGFSPTGTPRFLDFHLVIGSWIAVAIVTGMYLLNMFRLPHDTPNGATGPIQTVFALSFFGLGAYLCIGVFAARPPEGALWREIAAWAPPQVEVGNGDDGYFLNHDGLQYALDFDKAVKKASSSNTLMFLDFTGMNCLNCRKMEKVVLVQDEIHAVLEDLVRVQLYTDVVPGVPNRDGEHDRLLKRNRDLQNEWIGDITLPSYVIATPDGSEILATFKGSDPTAGERFREFLTYGVDEWERRKATAANIATVNASAPAKIAGFTDSLDQSAGEEFVSELDGLGYSLEFDRAQAVARKEGRPMFVEFVIINDMNCRAVEKRVVATPEVRSSIEDMVRVQVFVDQLPVPSPNAPRAASIVDRNREIQKALLNDNFIPTYLLLTPEGTVLSKFQGTANSNNEFRSFLDAGLANWDEYVAASKRTSAVTNTSFEVK